MNTRLRVDGFVAVNGRHIGLHQTHALLEGIAQERSVSGAAARLGVSYRSAWGRVLALEEAIGRPVVVKTKGHGSVLTEFGAALRDAFGTALGSFEPFLRQQERTLEDCLLALTGEARPRVRFALSHDPLLLSVLAELPSFEPSVVGSQEAVEQLLSGRADAAGFHAGEEGPVPSPPFDRLVQDPAFTVKALFTREQGLMTASGNPLAIRSVRDLARTKARFVNRQRGSGTRAWFDRLLHEADVPAAAIVGYDVAEFTHQAVAAVIAANAADAGMGVRSVAEKFGLGFVAAGRETYFVAARAEAVADAIGQIGPRVLALVPGNAGYGPPDLPAGRAAHDRPASPERRVAGKSAARQPLN